jgi:hypothetical protein
MGIGNGMFGSPNIAAIMNSVPPEDRGVASGMRSMLQNSGMVVSMALFFTIVIVSLTHMFPPELATSLAGAGAPELVGPMSVIPPTGALFAAFLGYNPVNAILVTLPKAVVAAISPATMTTLTGTSWFPTTLAHAFMPSLRISFCIGALLCIIAAVLSSLTGSRFVHEIHGKKGETPEETPVPLDDPGWDIIE